MLAVRVLDSCLRSHCGLQEAAESGGKTWGHGVPGQRDSHIIHDGSDAGSTAVRRRPYIVCRTIEAPLPVSAGLSNEFFYPGLQFYDALTLLLSPYLAGTAAAPGVQESAAINQQDLGKSRTRR